MAADLKPAHPARMPAGQLANVLSALGRSAMVAEGHGACGAWAYDAGRQVIACTCGGLSLQIAAPVEAVA